MSSEFSERSGKKAKDDVARHKRLQKVLSYLFTQNGLNIRNIRHQADDEVAVEDILACEHFNKQFSAEDFDHAVAKGSHDLILKEEPHFLLVTSDGRKVVKYFKEPLQYKESANVIQLNYGANAGLSQEFIAVEKVINEEEPGKREANEETEQRNEPATGGNKKKKNKLTADVNCAALSSDEEKTSASPVGTPMKKLKPEDRLKKIPNTFKFLFGDKNGLKEKNIPIGDGGFVKVKSIIEVYQSQYQWTEKEITAALDNNEDYIFKRDGTDGLLVKSAEQEPGSDDSWKTSGRRKESQEDRKQRPMQNSAASRPPGVDAVAPDKLRSTLFWILGRDGAAKHSIQFQSGKRLYIDEIINKVPNLYEVSVSEIKAAAESDPRKEFILEEIKGQATIRLQESRTSRPEERLKRIPNTFKFLFGDKDGLKEKNIPVGDGGFVQMKSIIEVYQSQYQWNEEEITAALGNSEDYIFKRDGTGGLLVKAAKQAASRPPEVGAVAPDKLRSTLFWILGRDGAAKHSIQFQSGKRVYIDEIINKVPNLHHVSASEIKAAAESDPRREFILEEIKGQATIRLQESRTPRVRNLTVLVV